jgi:CHAT domain-containing protein
MLLASLLISLPVFGPVEKFPLNLSFSAGLLPAVAQTQDARKSQADDLLQRGIEQYNNNQLKDAVQSCQQALDIYRAIDDQPGQADTLNCLGFAYRQLGDHGKAILYREQHKDLILKIGNPEAKAKSLSDLGIAYAELGDYDLANDHLNQSLKIAQQIHNPLIEGEALANLGATNQDLGNYNDAINYLNQSLAIVTKLGNLPTQSLVLYHLGVVHHALGQLSKAIGYYQQSLAIAQQKIHDPRLATAASSGLGFAYENLGNYSKAIEFHQQGIAIAQKANDQQREASALNNLGHTLLLSGNLPEAERQLRHAIEILDALRSGLNDTYKGSLFDTQVLTYNLLQQVLVAQNKFEAALEVSEWGRARAFVDLMVGRLSASSQGVNALRSTSAKPLTIEEIRQIAREQKATLVEYSIIPDEFVGMGKLRGKALELFIWVVQPTGEVAFQRINLKPEKIILDDLVVKSRESIGVKGRGEPSIAIETSEKVSQSERLQQLYRLLIQPIADLLPRDPNAHVIFLPHESLFLIPFPALQDASGQYLIEQHTILTAPAIQVLALTHQQSVNVRKAGLQDVLVVGNPVMPWVALEPKASPQQLDSLPFAELEANRIAELLHVTPLIGKQATKTAVLLQMPNARLIHLATHGLLDDTKGLEIPGAIALAPDPASFPLSKPDQEKGNGLLTAKEIQDLKLNAELVVLSACNTGRGRITGDGVIGLSRSLITAGVPSVIVSLWSVPDAPTGDLMVEFYRNWQQRKLDKAQALRQAMLTTMKTDPNPINWAAFMLMGEAE